MQHTCSAGGTHTDYVHYVSPLQQHLQSAEKNVMGIETKRHGVHAVVDLLWPKVATKEAEG